MEKQPIETQKITAHLPKQLLNDVQKYTNKGITETLKEALEQLKLAKVYAELLKMRGKYKFDIDLDELRKDKGEI